MLNTLRIGQGCDIHALVPDRKLIIGGVEIDYHLGLAGHSDADVLLHAICDALIGAMALGDIGKHFPDNNANYKNIDSRILLRNVKNLMDQNGYSLINLDSTIIAQAPKMAPHIPFMIENIANDLEVSPKLINIKAKTAEKLGFIGRGEGISTEVMVLLQHHNI